MTKPLTTKQLMLPGSVWKALTDVECFKDYNFRVGWDDAYDSTKINPDIKAGEEFTVMNKFFSGWYEKDGQMLETDKGVVRARDVVKNVENVSLPVVSFYVIRDSSTGLFYKGQDQYTDSKNPVTLPGFKHDYHKGTQVSIEVIVDFVATPRSAKMMKDLGKIKTRVLYNIGYFNEMGYSCPPMLHNYTPIAEVPDTWEIVEFNKINNEEVQTWSAKEYVEQTKRLGRLTTTFGSAVRDLYNKLEKKDELDEYTKVVVFYGEDTDKFNDDGAFEWKSGKNHDGESVRQIKDEEKKLINSVIKQSNLTAKNTRKSVTGEGGAIAVSDEDDAVLLKLTYEGSLSMKLLDLKKLEEIVG